MTRLGLFTAAMLLACAPVTAQKQGPVTLTADNADRIRQAGGSILFWN